MNAAVGIRTPAAALVEAAQRETRDTDAMFLHLNDTLEKSRREEARRVIARHANLLPLGHPWRFGPHCWNP